MTKDEEKLYRDLYKILTSPNVNDLLVQYSKIEYNKALKSIRTKRDEYDYGYGNGSTDTWQHIIDLKDRITAIMRNIG